MRKILPFLLVCCLLFCGCAAQGAEPAAAEPTGQMALDFAENFSVQYYENDAALLTLGGTDQFLLLPPDGEAPAAFSGLPVIRCPVQQVYLASSAVPDLFSQLGALDCVQFTSTDADAWRLPAMQEAVRSGEILFAGKYSAPDYELLLEQGSDLVVENTMIFHEPATKEKLEALGFPVMVDYSSYEPHPLGRVEWIKLYGLLTGRLAEAEAFFSAQEEMVQSLSGEVDTGKTVAFFHISPNGGVIVRRNADYVTRMIELAGGVSAFQDLPQDDTALSTLTISMETLYACAKDADVIIYNSTVPGDLASVEDLLALSPVFEEFRAVQSGAVWCTEQSMFQQTSAAAGMISNIHQILTGQADGEDALQFLHRVK